MPKRSRKPALEDSNPIAHVVEEQAATEKREKDPAAVALGRKGGLKGGYARAAKMTKAQLSASAQKAAKARWANRRKAVEGAGG